MSQLFEIHPLNPQLRLIRRAVEIIRAGGVIVYPTDSCYALGCHLGDKEALERIRRIRMAGKEHHFTLVCRDLSQIAHYARIDNSQYRLLRKFTPGPYTFLLRATRETPKRLQNPRRRTIGMRVPDHPVPRLLLKELGEPIMSSTLLLPGDALPMTDALEIRERLEQQVDVVLDGGNCGLEPTTVIDLVGEVPSIVRRGRGRTEAFEPASGEGSASRV
jgi:tRNA threonylcarbamoyl adenosine modification protein (Sua5/YciO/YrdC/YwlC family)